MSETSPAISAALALVEGLDPGGRLSVLPDDSADPPAPSRLVPLIREALNANLFSQAAAKLRLGPVPYFWQLVALNPQPLPPLPAQLASALVTRAEPSADASGEDKAASNVQQVVDDLCPYPASSSCRTRALGRLPGSPRPSAVRQSGRPVAFCRDAADGGTFGRA